MFHRKVFLRHSKGWLGRRSTPLQREWPRLRITARIKRPSSLYMILPSSLASLSWNGTRVGPTAAVERAHSDRARCTSTGDPSSLPSCSSLDRFSSISKGSGQIVVHRAHRATTVLSWGLCEQEGHLATPYPNVTIVTPSPPSARSPARNPAT